MANTRRLRAWRCRCNEAVVAIGSRLEDVVFGLSNADVLLDAQRIEGVQSILEHFAGDYLSAPRYTDVISRRSCSCRLGTRCYLESARPALVSCVKSFILAERKPMAVTTCAICDWSMPPMFAIALDENIEVDSGNGTDSNVSIETAAGCNGQVAVASADCNVRSLRGAGKRRKA